MTGLIYSFVICIFSLIYLVLNKNSTYDSVLCSPVSVTKFDIFVQTRTCLLIRFNVFHLLTEEEERMDERMQDNV